MFLYRIISKSLWDERLNGEGIYPESNDKFIFINEAQISSDLDNYWGGLECVILKIDTSQFNPPPKDIGNNSYEYTGKIPLDSIVNVDYRKPTQKNPLKFTEHEDNHFKFKMHEVDHLKFKMHEVGHLSYSGAKSEEYGDQTTFMGAYGISTSHTKSNASDSSKEPDNKNSYNRISLNQSDSKKLKHQM